MKSVLKKINLFFTKMNNAIENNSRSHLYNKDYKNSDVIHKKIYYK